MESHHWWFFAISNFFVSAKYRKIFSRKSFFLKICFVENILQWRTPYVETNEASEK
jgi:hypothetical protein